MSAQREESLKIITAILTKATVNDAGAFRLPSERALAEEMQLQRSTIRNALSALEFFGFIERTQGSGTYLQVPKMTFANVYFDIAVQLGYISHDTIENARESFELLIVEEAAKHATDDEVRELQRLCGVMVDAKSFDDKVDADYQFHIVLAGMTHNPVIVLFYQSIASFIRGILSKRRALVSAIDQTKTKINSNHHAIVEAIASRDVQSARLAMKAHFEHWEREKFLIDMLTDRRT